VAKRRFVAPAREEVPRERFEHPSFAPYRFELDLLSGERWPDIGTLNARACGLKHAVTGRGLRFVEQTPELLADGLHYETRIFERGEIPTRADNWHDLLNALVWLRYPQLKSALNARQAADVAEVGPASRTRGQCALTHFDEAGLIVRVSDTHTLSLWNAHDWGALGARVQLDPEAIEVQVFGHALLEHALYPEPLLVGKAIAVLAEPETMSSEIVRVVAEGIRGGELLTDPQQLRPLPTALLPGWHPRSGQAEFLRVGECFRPLRAGRVYPGAVRVASCAFGLQ
jgi:hypothetical protein